MVNVMDGISTDENESRRVRAEKSSNMAKVFKVKPKPLDFVMPGLVVGTPGLLIAPGATGKSFWALQAGISIASGSKTFGINAERTGEVVFLSAEDPKNIVEGRLFEMGSYLSTNERIRAEKNFFLIDYCNKQIDIMNNKTCLEIINICNGARLIIIDTMSRVHQLMENDNGQMSKLISQVGNIAKETKAAVLICHHTSKKAHYEGHANEQQSARGASSLVDNSRYVGFLSKMTSVQSKKLSLWKEGPHISEDEKHRYVEAGVAKQNYGEPMSSCWYQRQNGGVLLPVILHEIKDGQNKSTNTNIRYGKKHVANNARTKHKDEETDDDLDF